MIRGSATPVDMVPSSEEVNTPCKNLNELFNQKVSRASNLSSLNSKYIVSPAHPGKLLSRKEGFVNWKQTGEFNSEVIKQNEEIFHKA